MAYFIRTTNDPEVDLSRGFSFHGYLLMSEKSAMLETIAENMGFCDDPGFDIEAWAAENEWRVAQDPATGKWGQRHSGLCAHAAFDTLEEAREALILGEYTHAAGGDFAPAHIFEGVEVYDPDIDGQDEGIIFLPSRVAYDPFSALGEGEKK